MTQTNKETPYAARREAAELVTSRGFVIFVTAVTIINVAYLGYQTDYHARHLHASPPVFFKIMNLMFALIFTAEICMRIFAFRWAFFCSPTEWGPNWLEVLIVLQFDCE